jgi:FkbM family methyltransferase
MIFTFWTGSAAISLDFVDFWTAHVPGFRVFSDGDVLTLIEKQYPKLYVPYSSIRIPSCKSDVARLILLQEFGGLYIDAHASCPSLGSLAAMLSNYGNYELGVLDVISNHTRPGDLHLVNGAIYARKNSSCINKLLLKVLANVLDHYRIERYSFTSSSYNLAVLTGAWNIRSLFFETNSEYGDIRLRDEFKTKVLVIPLGSDKMSPLQFYRHYGYRSPGTHWSERQKCEPLFDLPRSAKALNGIMPSGSGDHVNVDELAVQGHLLNHQKRYDEALVLLLPGLAITPVHHWLNFQIGRAYSGTGDREAATAHFLTAASSDHPFRVGAMYEVVNHDLSVGIFDHVDLLDAALILPGDIAGKDPASQQKRHYYFQIQFLRAMLLLKKGECAVSNELLEAGYDFSLAVDERIFEFNWVLDMLRALPALSDLPNVEYLRQRLLRHNMIDGINYGVELSKMTDTKSVLEIGAMDGVRFDPLHRHLVDRHWDAVLVEPLPDMFDLLQKNYQSYRTIRCINAAIAEASGPLSLYRVKPAAVSKYGHGEWVIGISSAVKGPTLTYLDDIVTEEVVRGVSFADFVNELSIQKIDVLQIDTEGYEWRILKQIDLSKWRIELIHIQVINLRPIDRLNVFITLNRAGYVFTYDGMDVTAVRENWQ